MTRSIVFTFFFFFITLLFYDFHYVVPYIVIHGKVKSKSWNWLDPTNSRSIVENYELVADAHL